MTREHAIKRYKNLGLEIEKGYVEPDYVYPRHHHGTTYLYVTRGSVVLKKDDTDLLEYKKGDEFVVTDGEYHEGKAGPEGYSFVAGWNKEEYKKYPEDQWY